MGYLTRFLKWFSVSGVILFLIFILLGISTGEFKIKALSNNDSRGSFKYERAIIPRGYVYIKIYSIDIDFYKKNKSKFTSCDKFIFLYMEHEYDKAMRCHVEINKKNEILFIIPLSDKINNSNKEIYVTYDIDELKGKYKDAGIFTSTNVKLLPDWLVIIIFILCVLLLSSMSYAIISPIKYFFRDR